MGRKVTAIRIDFNGREPSVRALSKSTGGTTFTLRSVPLDTGKVGEKIAPAVLNAAIAAALQEPGETF